MIRNITILLLLSLSFGTVTDIDGNVYETVQIGNQLWMVENLKVTRYNNGDEIPTGYGNFEWIVLETGAFAVYPTDDDNASQTTCGDDCADIYGNLYNFAAVDDDRGICMEGWHVPSDEEFKELEMELGMSQEEADNINIRGTNEGAKLAGSAELWSDECSDHNGDGCNLVNNAEFATSGFNAIPAGYRPYDYMGDEVGFWSSTKIDETYVWSREIYKNISGVFRHINDKKNWGFSVRCLADEITTGCTGESSCNYNPDANVDDGSCIYPNDHHDCEGNCLVELDCAGNCCVIGDEGCYWQETGPCGEAGPNNGTDSCGVCGGDNSSCADCAGVPCSDAYVDNCGICDDIPENDCQQDCTGTWGGNAYVDDCGICDNDSSNDCTQGCDDEWGSGLELDECGVCGGDGSLCSGCTDLNACNYDETADIDDESCEYYDPEIMCDCDETFLDVNGDCCGYLVMDECMVCNGDGIVEGACDCEGNVLDCAGTCGGDLELDCGGVCGGDNSTALSCCGLPFNEDCTTDCHEDSMGTCCVEEDADECGLCFGDGSSCCEEGEINDDNPCNPWECWNDQWYEIIIDCAEQEGVPCEGGIYVSPEEGECCSVCVLSGDMNGDGTINVIDIVMAVDFILTNNYDVVGDLNEDGQLNVIDIVMLVDWILNGIGCSDGSSWDYDMDGICDAEDADDDNDNALDSADSDDNNEYVCSDVDGDNCDDCSSGTFDPANDGIDMNGNGICDEGEANNDTDGDGVIDDEDSDPFNPYQCSDLDGDTCDDCSNGTFNPTDDGYDYDGDGQCDDGDCDDDNDGCQECWDYCP